MRGLFILLLLVLTSLNYAHAQDYTINKYELAYKISENKCDVSLRIEISAFRNTTITLPLGDFAVEDVYVDNNPVSEEQYAYNLLKINLTSGKHIILADGIKICKNKAESSISLPSPAKILEVEYEFDKEFYRKLKVHPTPEPYEWVENKIVWLITNANSLNVKSEWQEITLPQEIERAYAIITLADKDKAIFIYHPTSAGSFNYIKLSFPSNYRLEDAIATYAGSDYHLLDFAEIENNTLSAVLPRSTNSLLLTLKFEVLTLNITQPTIFLEKGATDAYACALAVYAKGFEINVTSATNVREISPYERQDLLDFGRKYAADYVLVATYEGQKFSLLISKEKVEEVGVLATIIKQATYDILPTKDFALVKATYRIVNTEPGKTLELTLPDNATFWGALIDGENAFAYKEQEKIKIPLPLSEKVGNDYRDFELIVIYTQDNVQKGNVLLTYLAYLPKISAPILEGAIKLGLPTDFKKLKMSSKPEMELKIVEFIPTRPYRQITLGGKGFFAQQAQVLREIGVEKQVEEVVVTKRGVPIEIEIPRMNKYLEGKFRNLKPNEEVYVEVVGMKLESKILWTFLLILFIIIIVWKRNAIKKVMW